MQKNSVMLTGFTFKTSSEPQPSLLSLCISPIYLPVLLNFYLSAFSPPFSSNHQQLTPSLSHGDFVSNFTKQIEAIEEKLPNPLPTQSASHLVMEAFCRIHFLSSAERSRPTWWVYFYSICFFKAKFKASAKYSEIGIQICKSIFLINSLPLVNHEHLQWFLWKSAINYYITGSPIQ